VGLVWTSNLQSNSAGDFLYVPGKDISIINGFCLVRLSCHLVYLFAMGPN